MPAKIIALTNQKGGVTKSTSTEHLGIGLAMQGKRVLVVDADPQGDLTTCLGWNPDELDNTISNLILAAMSNQPPPFQQCILHHQEGIDLIPSNIELSELEVSIVTAMGRERLLSSCLNELRERYDYILIDCPPSLNMLTVNALAAADSVIIPVQAEYLAAKGMTQLINSINKVRRVINPSLYIEGILMTLVKGRTRFAQSIITTLRQSYGDVIHIFRSQIPVSTKAAEVSTKGVSLFIYNKTNPVALAYTAFAKEVASRGERQRISAQSAHSR